DGGHTVAATAADAIGNISVASPGRTFAVDTAAPNAPVVIGPLAGSATSDTTPTFNGTAEVGSTVAVKDGLTTICTATTNGSGAWSCTPGVALSVGSHTVAATASDAAGNISAASPDRTFTVDTAAPSTPVASSPAAGGTISDTTPTFSGMAEAGSAITVTDGLATLCAATTSAGGNWSCTPTMPLSEGGHTVAIIASDAAGNSSTPASHSFTVDTSAPSTPSMTNLAPASITNDTTPAISGVADVGSTITLVLDPDNDPSTTDSVTYTTTVAANGTWSIDTATVTPTSGTFPASGLAEGTVGLSVIATDLANNTSAPLTQTFTIDIIAPAAPSITGPTAGSTTRDSTPTISGTAEANSTSTVTEGLTALCTITADATGAWSCAPSVALSDGNHTIRATATDAAGNTSPVSPHRAFMIDTSAPSAPVVSSPAAGSAASDATPTFSGTAEPGSTVTVVEGTTTLCTATADGAGMWSCAPITPLSAGDHSITVIVTDPAGNTGPASDPRTVTIDTSTAIAPTITSPTPGSTTTDPTPTFSGTGEPGSSATMNEGTTVLCVATADSNGDWSCTPTAPLANGYHDITVVVTDPHGATILTAALPITVVGPLKLYYMPLIR
ncbi:MAG TPA: Ig-like domain-containing protein, partial [Roseiflexaceae bacterium]|nr:Ig-like domain-containing protein [Roseiflexaceae bacterium]